MKPQGQQVDLMQAVQGLTDATTNFAQKQNAINNTFVKRINSQQNAVTLLLLMIVIQFILFIFVWLALG